MRIIKKVLPWLEAVLSERYGHNFAIRLLKSQLIVSLSETPNKIIFPKLIVAFYETRNIALPCQFFDAEKAGFSVPFDKILPLPGIDKAIEQLVSYDNGETVINYDILGLTYWMLSRQEEVGAVNLDLHGRFPATASHAYQHGYLERPIVDEWLFILGQIIEKTWENIQLKEHHFSMKVSHDVDRPSHFGFSSFPLLLRKMRRALLRKDFSLAIQAPAIWIQTRKKLHPKDPYNTFTWLMDISEQHNLKSAFYFICGATDKQYDADYHLSHPAIKNLMKNISDRGHEIGLHPSYSTYQNQEVFLQEADTLKTVCQELGIVQPGFGGRMHYLRWQPETMMLWEKAGMAYDSTLSYADRPGFRCGTCFGYPAINPITKEVLNLRIRPLIAMECSIISVSYLGLGTSKEAMDKFNQLKYACKSVNGCFTLLWHNSEFSTTQKKLYAKILKF